MYKNYFALAPLIFFAPIANAFAESEQNICLIGVPIFSGEVINQPPNSLPVYIESNTANVNLPNNAIYTGNVAVLQGNRQLFAPKIEMQREKEGDIDTRYAYIEQDIVYKDELINLTGHNAKINLDNKNGYMHDITYQFNNRQGRGNAEDVQLNDQRRFLTNATYTACPIDDNTWEIYAHKMVHDSEREVAEMQHAVFKIKNIPVFYFPYLQYPIGNKRRSGLLFPKYELSNRDGFSYSHPIYWNIAPNVDATFTPKYMSRRGWQLNSELRYLTKSASGLFAYEFLARDRLPRADANTNKNRKLFYWQHSSNFYPNWHFNVDYTHVGDKQYFNDNDSEYGKNTSSYATQNVMLQYRQPNYNLSIAFKQFQVFEQLNTQPYRTSPDIRFNYFNHKTENGFANFKLFSQIVHFANHNPELPTAWRYHAEPSVSIPFTNDLFSLDLEGKIYATHYRQKHKGNNADQLPKSINRIIPQLKLDLSTIITQPISLLSGYTHTLEPRIQYLYRPFKDQGNIGKTDSLSFGYDSTLLTQDYYSIFSERRYSGLDRIASANQLSIGITSRLFDKHAQEKLNISLGQIFYFKPSRIDHNINNTNSHNKSAIALEINAEPLKNIKWHFSYQYDPILRNAPMMNTSIEYKPKPNDLLQLNYRYINKKFINANISGMQSHDKSISQIGLVASKELNKNWYAIGSYSCDTNFKRTIERYIAVEYKTCCWAMRLGLTKSLTAPRQGQSNSTAYYNRSIRFEIELLGFDNRPKGVTRMLPYGILPFSSKVR